jgi:hypothetical protein
MSRLSLVELKRISHKQYRFLSSDNIRHEAKEDLVQREGTLRRRKKELRFEMFSTITKQIIWTAFIHYDGLVILSELSEKLVRYILPSRLCQSTVNSDSNVFNNCMLIDWVDRSWSSVCGALHIGKEYREHA